MPALVPPYPTLRRSFLEAYDELARAEGPDEADRWLGLAGRDVVDLAALTDPDRFAEFCAALRRSALEGEPRPAGYVPDTVLWWVDGERFLGRLSIRHRLTPFLRDVGGHVGYLVRPTARRQGHATAMLAAALPVAARLGIDPILVTCDDDNHASRRVIERCGGMLEDQRGRKLRYWVPAGAR